MDFLAIDPQAKAIGKQVAFLMKRFCVSHIAQQLQQKIMDLLAIEPQAKAISIKVAFLKRHLKAGKFNYHCLFFIHANLIFSSRSLYGIRRR